MLQICFCITCKKIIEMPKGNNAAQLFTNIAQKAKKTGKKFKKPTQQIETLFC